MSLTRQEWIDMWSLVILMAEHDKQIDHAVEGFLSPYRKKLVRDALKNNAAARSQIKRYVESVIGQME